MRISKVSKFISTLTFIILLFFVARTANAQTNQWRPVSSARQSNIIGMALVEHDNSKTTFIIVNDNKKPEQNHVALLTIEGRGAPKYRPLKWLGDDASAIDFEAISAVPDRTNNFMALTATGRVFHIELDRAGNSVKVIKSFAVPQIPQTSDFEGFALQKVGDVLLAVWADRSLDAKPAQIFWSKFDLQSDAFLGETTSAFLKVPYSTANTRHVSDIKVDRSGAVFVSSASDPGNDGPFASAVYFAGTFNFCDTQKIGFVQSPALTRLFAFDYHKVEAVELVPGANGGMAFGTDDENLGAAVYLDW